MHGPHAAVEQPGPVELAQDRRDAAGPVHVLHVIVAARGHLAQAGDPARQLVDVLEPEAHACLVSRGEQVQDRIGRAAHGHIERHRVLERVAAGDRPGQHRIVAVGVVAPGELDDHPAGLLEQRPPRDVRGQRGAVARQGQADGLGQAVHRVRGEHPRAGAAGGAGRLLDPGQRLLRHRRVGGGHHRVDQVELASGGRRPRGGGDRGAGFHRAAGHEDRGDVEPHGGDQHARGDLVAVGDADHRVRAVRVDHVLDRVGDQLAAGQRVQHAAVPHRDAVVHRDRVELAGHRPGGADRGGDDLADLAQVHVSGNELGEAVGHRDDRLADVLAGDPGGPQQGPGARHVPAVRDGPGSKRRHDKLPSRR